MKKQYNIKVQRYFDKSQDCNVLEINVSKELTDLLKQFAITNEEMRDTSFNKSVLNEGSDDYKYIQRYLVKSILKNSVRWTSTLDLLFTKELLTKQSIKIPLNSLRVFDSISENVESIKQLVKVAEEINTSKELNISLNIED